MNELEPYTFTVEDLLERYMRRFHEGPTMQGPLPAQVVCQACWASALYVPECDSVMLIDFPPQVVI